MGDPLRPHAEADTGLLSGSWDEGIAVFKGIPFAAPPVGALRWRPPQPAAGWTGVRTACAFGPAPLQPQPPRDSVMYHTNFDDRQPLVISEDCLYLNVWTPDPSGTAGLAVLVWVQGGGNRYGYGSQDIHNGARLAGRGIVVVTLNHRLGALGFLAHPALAAEDELGAAGNYGLLDLIAALQWVRRNIAGFGGDPDKVTLAGNSAGAAHITHLMAAPSAAGLFRAAIGQSAAGIFRAEGALPDRSAALESGLRFAARFPRSTVADLRRMSGLELTPGGHFGPVIDGRALVGDTQQAFVAGKQAAVPLLVGSNTDEGATYTSGSAAVELIARAEQSPLRAAFEAAYPTGDDLQARRSARLFIGESRFGYPVWRWATTHASTCGAPTWLYRFAHEPPLPPGLDLAPPPDGVPGYGAFHTAELPYMTDNLYLRAWDWTDTDRHLAAAMADAWVRFVTHVDPNGPGLPTWHQINGTDDAPVLVFADEPRAGTVERADALRLLDALPRPL